MSATDTQHPPHLIGHRIAQERERLGLTPAELAAKLGISLRKMNAIEAGSQRPLTMQLMAYLAHCGVDLSYVLIGKSYDPVGGIFNGNSCNALVEVVNPVEEK